MLYGAAMTRHFLGVIEVADAFGVSRHAVHKWRARYPAGSRHPFPEPDVEIDGAPGWRSDRLTAIAAWREGLPGRGAGGGRPTAARQDYLRAAAARGLTREEAERALGTFVEEFPEMDEPQLYAWLVEKFS
jgi:transposase-like protein